jgi:myo-inositol-1(or 4)-monophosphatase
VRYKGPEQPVTDADLLADGILRERLRGERPGYGWLSEESADSPERLERDAVWVVDPIDGTSSFVDGVPEWAVSVGLVLRGEVVLGVVFNPATGETYHAVRGEGAFRDGERIRVSTAAADAVSPSLAASRAEMRRGDLEGIDARWRLTPLGSTTYKMMYVADGRADAFLSRGPKSEWDLCAAALVVAEAGGRVTDTSGAALRFNQPQPATAGVVVSNGALHAELLRYLADHPR